MRYNHYRPKSTIEDNVLLSCILLQVFTLKIYLNCFKLIFSFTIFPSDVGHKIIMSTVSSICNSVFCKIEIN